MSVGSARRWTGTTGANRCCSNIPGKAGPGSWCVNDIGDGGQNRADLRGGSGDPPLVDRTESMAKGVPASSGDRVSTMDPLVLAGGRAFG
jgi:hypothetical protein